MEAEGKRNENTLTDFLLLFGHLEDCLYKSVVYNQLGRSASRRTVVERERNCSLREIPKTSGWRVAWAVVRLWVLAWALIPLVDYQDLGLRLLHTIYP